MPATPTAPPARERPVHLPEASDVDLGIRFVAPGRPACDRGCIRSTIEPDVNLQLVVRAGEQSRRWNGTA